MHVHVHVDHNGRNDAEMLQKLDQVLTRLEALRLQGVTMSEKSQQVQDLLQKLFDNTNAEAARNQQRSTVIDGVSAHIDALTAMIQNGTPGLSPAEADQAIASLTQVNNALDALKTDEEAQMARLQALGSPTSPDPVPAPVEQPPVEPPPPPPAPEV